MSFNPLESIKRYRQQQSPSVVGSEGADESLNGLRASMQQRGGTKQHQQASPRLAMSQRRYGEQMEVRLELENEVDTLKKQVASLKADKKKIQEELTATTNKMKNQKAKYDEKIRSLRNQLATKQHLTGTSGNTIHNDNVRNRGDGTVVSSVNQAVSPVRFPPRDDASRSSYRNENSNRSLVNFIGFNTSSSSSDHVNVSTTLLDEVNDGAHKGGEISGFQGPTFSELMRISAKDNGSPDHPNVFTNTLRKHQPVDWTDKIAAIKSGHAPNAVKKDGSRMTSKELMQSYRYTDEKYTHDIPVVEIDLSRVES